jgi:hypothetical protein
MGVYYAGRNGDAMSVAKILGSGGRVTGPAAVGSPDELLRMPDEGRVA